MVDSLIGRPVISFANQCSQVGEFMSVYLKAGSHYYNIS